MKINRKIIYTVCAVILGVGVSSCEDFFEPEITTLVEEQNMFREWNDFRAAEMGLYAIQQTLTEQLLVLGELRADLLEITPNADPNLVEIYNFKYFEGNPYLSPVNFYKLIVNSNNLMNKIKERKPLVGNPQAIDAINSDSDPNNDHIMDRYDNLYGSALCMRAWAYFNAVRIYGRIPYVPSEITDINQIEEYLNTGKVVVKKDYVLYGSDGYYYNDTIPDTTIVLDRIWLDTEAIIDTFTYQLTHQIVEKVDGAFKSYAVGVDYNIDGLNDNTWDVTTWNQYAYRTLLGQMYFTKGDLWRAEDAFNSIVFFTAQNEERFLLTSRSYEAYFSGTPNVSEHILVVPYSKQNKQQSGFQRLFDNSGSNQFMLKPTDWAVWLFETDWDGWSINPNAVAGTRLNGRVNDSIRGNGMSYVYSKDGAILSDKGLVTLLNLKKEYKDFEVEAYMSGADTLVYKYTKGKSEFDRDADFVVYRAGGVHLWMAELLHRSQDQQTAIDLPGTSRTGTSKAINIITNGNQTGSDNTVFNTSSRGVRGRVGRGSTAMSPAFLAYMRDPFTNVVYSYEPAKMTPAEGIDRFEDYILEERGREVAFEGERFYDIMRMAKRRNDPSFLADRVARKFSSNEKEVYRQWVQRNNNDKGAALIGDRSIRMREFLMNEQNWYIPFFTGAFKEASSK